MKLRSSLAVVLVVWSGTSTGKVQPNCRVSALSILCYRLSYNMTLVATNIGVCQQLVHTSGMLYPTIQHIHAALNGSH